jgi:hypothetical protein
MNNLAQYWKKWCMLLTWLCTFNFQKMWEIFRVAEEIFCSMS